MYHQWFFRRRCCCCRTGYQSNGNTGSVVSSTVYYRHFMDVPMRVFYGAGFTAEDSLESIDASLQTIAAHCSGGQSSSRRNCC